MDRVERELRSYYEAEAIERLRPEPSGRRRSYCQRFASRLAAAGCSSVLDVGAGPGSDQQPFDAAGVQYVGVDLAVGNAQLAATSGRIVVPASLFGLPFRSAAFSAGWSMSTFQHVPDAQIDDGLDEFARVLRSGAPVAIGLWGGRDEVIESTGSTTGLALPRQFSLRSHDRISALLRDRFVIEDEFTYADGPSDWEYHFAWGHKPD